MLIELADWDVCPTYGDYVNVCGGVAGVAGEGSPEQRLQGALGFSVVMCWYVLRVLYLDSRTVVVIMRGIVTIECCSAEIDAFVMAGCDLHPHWPSAGFQK